jgi:hypothetical protein
MVHKLKDKDSFSENSYILFLTFIRFYNMLHVATVKVHHQTRINEEATKYLELPLKLLNLK